MRSELRGTFFSRRFIEGVDVFFFYIFSQLCSTSSVGIVDFLLNLYLLPNTRNQTGIVREMHGMQNGFRCNEKGEPGERGEKGEKGGSSLDGVSFYFYLF